jgi:hypothetical protein
LSANASECVQNVAVQSGLSKVGLCARAISLRRTIGAPAVDWLACPSTRQSGAVQNRAWAPETLSTPGWVRPMRESLGSAHRVLFHLQPSARGPFRRDTGEKLYLKRFAQSNMLKRRVAARGVRQLVHSLIGSDLCCNAVKNFVSRCRLELRVHGSAFFACQVVLAVDVLDARSSVAPRIIRCRGR